MDPYVVTSMIAETTILWDNKSWKEIENYEAWLGGRFEKMKLELGTNKTTLLVYFLEN